MFGLILPLPFLSEKNSETIAEAGQSEEFQTRIKVPYMIVSVLLILAAVWLIVNQIKCVSRESF